MAKKRQPTTLVQTTQPGQRSAPGGEPINYLLRIPTYFGLNSKWWEAEKWRLFVQMQPIAVVFRETLISYIQNLDWAVVPRDSEQQDELKSEIDYYTKLFENTSGYYSDYDFTTHIEFILKDLLDLPFGGASEFGRENNDPNGKVVWIRPLDGGTLIPTLNKDFPVAQRVDNYNPINPVLFPSETISRIFISPRTELRLEGWGMAPPEKIYLAMEMLRRGDQYYASLLLNTPEAGILDLGDMEKTSAEEWIQSFQALFTGVDPFKIPVLYEHTTDSKWIPFGNLPNDIMYDNITKKYAAIVGAGYGMTLSDIGLGGGANGGETLAGTIRGERHTNSSGKATVKKKLITYFNKFLPETLKFKWIDYDAETQVAQGRARLANAQASEIQIRNQVFSPDEMRRQSIQDGLLTISVPEKLDRKGVEWPLSGGSLGANSLGQPKSASTGGHGEILSNDKTVIRADIAKAVSKAYSPIKILVQKAKTTLNEKNSQEWAESIDKTIFFDGETNKNIIESAKDRVLRAFSDQFGIVFAPKKGDLEPVFDQITEHLVAKAETQAQADFVLEKRSDSILCDEEYLELEKKARLVNVEQLLADSAIHSSQTWLNLVTNLSLSTLKDVLLSKLSLDADNGIGDNKLEVVNDVAQKVAEAIPELDAIALEAGEKYMKNKIDMEVK